MGGNAAEWLRRQEVHVSLRGGEVACLIPKLWIVIADEEGVLFR